MEEFIGRVALGTGANRGIGLEVTRQLALRGFTTVLGARDAQQGDEAARSLQQDRLKVIPVQLNVTDQQTIDAAKRFVEERFSKLDVLVNNAAILYDEWQRAENANLETVREAFETNTLGAWRMCQTFIPLLRQSKHVRIVNVSSESGSLTIMAGPNAPRTVEEGAASVLWAATLPDDGMTGGFFRDGEPLPW